MKLLYRIGESMIIELEKDSIRITMLDDFGRRYVRTWLFYSDVKELMDILMEFVEKVCEDRARYCKEHKMEENANLWLRELDIVARARGMLRNRAVEVYG